MALVIGLFSFGFIEEFTHSMRNSILALIGFFVLGLFCIIDAHTKEKSFLQFCEALLIFVKLCVTRLTSYTDKE